MSDTGATDQPHVMALAASADHRFSKHPCDTLELVTGIGAVGDAHAGATVKHRSRVAANPAAPNLRQVHLIHGELLARLAAEGLCVRPGELGENMTTQGIDLLALPRGSRLQIGATVQLEVTGLRNPCVQIEAFRPGLLARLARKRPDGSIERLAGIMCVVRHGGRVQAGDRIAVTLPPQPHQALLPV